MPKYIGPLEPGLENTAVVTAPQTRESGRRDKAKPETAPEPDLTRAKSAHRMRHLPNAITIARILVTPVLLVLLLSGTLLGQFLALILFVGAAISDYVDGSLARRYGVGSRLGQFLDPFADKVLVLGTFAVLSYLMPDQVPWWGVVLVAVRDFAVTGLRSWVEARGKSLRTSGVAKAKTTVQLTFLISVLVFLVAAKLPSPAFLVNAAEWLLTSGVVFVGMMIVVVFTVVTGVMYFARPDVSSPSTPTDV